MPPSRAERDKAAEVMSGMTILYGKSAVLPNRGWLRSMLTPMKVPAKLSSASSSRGISGVYRTFRASIENILLEDIASDCIANMESFADGVRPNGDHPAGEATCNSVWHPGAQQKRLLLLAGKSNE